MDGIGNLPEEVLCHILSFLTTKEAALTSILSKRWRNLFTLVPNIDIDDSVFLNPEEGKREREGILQSFMDFVDKVLSLQGDSPIVKFSLKCKTGIDTDRLNRWICNVLRRGVASLDLVLDFDRSDDDLDSDYMYFLPRELFVSPKLVELRLRSEFGVDWWRGGSRDTLLPMVKTLCFESTWILLCDDLEVFLSAFPVLEEFHMVGIEWPDSDESVSSQSLRKLTLYAGGFEDWRNPKSISFDTPNLVYLEYSDYVAADYPKVNLPNLAEAVLDLKVTGHQIDLIRAPDDEDVVSLRLGNVWKLVKGLRNVQRLFISAETLELLSLCCESMPVFNNLKTLRIVSDADLGWQAMPALLRNSPHLETLILKGLLHHVTEKCGDVCDCIPREDDKGRSLSSCPVKKLEIRGFKGTVREKEMIRHFLESFPCLDEMEVYASADNQNDPTTNLQVNRIYKIVAYKVQGEEVTTETVLQSKSMSQTQMEEISSQFTPRNNRNMYDFVYILHGAPPPSPPPQDMSEDYLKEQLDAANTKLAELDAAKTKLAELDAANETELAANKTELAELDEEYKERQRVLDAMFDRIVEQNPTIASALKARQSATEGSNDQEKKERDVEALLEIMTDLYPDFASALRVMRGGTDLERGETSRDQGELDQTTTSTAVATDRDGN
ncbi:F-box/LRR-repeat protein [Raphanus sativus]|uniref:F-box protein At3g03040 n=1 Tax=Raphanus sativus TaxID=3726 RepID=A0A6J0PA26_RAPSA|nr:F-box protein At3g03040 [Raphanus sativus]KAJ4897085.1 F-box/LRR-repeat protein [Raphanus sativus]